MQNCDVDISYIIRLSCHYIVSTKYCNTLYTSLRRAHLIPICALILRLVGYGVNSRLDGFRRISDRCVC